MKKSTASPSWKDVKAMLAQQSPQELLQLLRDVYALRPEVQDCLHARLLGAQANVTPYKKTIHQSLYPTLST